MDYCPLHEIEYSNPDDECPLCARNSIEGAARRVA
jgi:hypothetical protein